MDEFEKEIKEEFLCEARDLLSETENSFLQLENSPKNPDLLNEIFRLAHNLKGTSKAVGFDKISDFTHSAENLILKIQQGEIEANSGVISTLLEFKDHVETIISLLMMDASAPYEIAEVKEKIEKTIEQESGIKKHEESFQQVNDTEVVPLENGENKVESVPKEHIGANNQNNSKVKKTSQAMKTNCDEDIRVKLTKIDQINDFIGELVILQTLLEQRKENYIKDVPSNNAISQMSKVFKELQQISMSLRMVPLKTTFQKMKRIVRDVSGQLDKKVNFHLHGEETEIDKKVLEHLSDPLVHIIRNAADHGIELPEQRKQLGKEESGNIEILAFHEGNNLVILITDDGKGINTKRLEQKAIQNQILDSNHQLSDQDLVQFIFHPGLSTKEEISDVSGRGVGMDVVKTNIEKMGGEIKVMTKEGQGSCFRIELPLTLAIIDGAIIRVDEQRYAVPLIQLKEVFSFERSKIVQLPKGGEYFEYRSQVIPLFSLNKKLGQKRNESKTATLVLVESDSGIFGIEIDEIQNKQQIVIKGLDPSIQKDEGVVGGTILGDGNPAFIIDFVEAFRNDFKQKEKIQNNKIAS